MASAELRDELNCSICLSLYTDPVSLRCGHNFCRSCIVSVLDAQEAAGGYSCPDCRAEYPERPALEKNRKLRNIVERFSSTQPDMEETRIFCTYCTKSPVPAVRTCLHCEASFCEKHLTRHSKSPEHTLVDPTVTLDERKCSTHKEVLKYYCPIEGACLCVSCWGAGDHKGHDLEPLNMAYEKKKREIKPVFENIKSKRKEAEKRIQNLKDHRTEQEKKSAGLADRVTLLFTDLRKKLDDLEKKIQGEISRQKDQMSLSVTELVKTMELHVNKLTKDINHLEGLCTITDPLTFLQDVNTGDISDGSSDVIGDVRDAPCMDEGLVSQILHRGLGNFTNDLIDMKKKRQFPVMEKSDLLLDIDTAQNNIIISQDLRSASYSATSQNRPDGPKRFKSRQVLSSCSFSSGRHYWEVDVSQAKKWIIGVVEESLERKVNGNESYIGYNDKSWALKIIETFGFIHNNIYTTLASDSPVRVVGIYLDYEAGHLSFYQVCGPIRHLYTFTASFSEPLYAALYLYEGSTIKIRPAADVTPSVTSTLKSVTEEEAARRGSKGRNSPPCSREEAFQLSTMASAELRDELNCSICLSLYTDPVSLRCGHNFCRSCIVSVLDAQEAAGGYSCPDCRAEYPGRPALEKNRKLRNIVERFSSTQPDMEEYRIFCTYCDSPVPAVRTCLHCEASFCEKHLTRHSKSSEHTLVDPTVTLEERKCSTHKEMLKYYCPEDEACICVSCWVAGDHKGHDVELLDVASEKKKEKIRFVFDKLKSERKEVKKRIQNLMNHETKEEEKSAGLADRVSGLFTDLRKKLDHLENRIRGAISRQQNLVSFSVSFLIGMVDLHLDELTKNINQLERLCDNSDPLTVLHQDLKSVDIREWSCDFLTDVRSAYCFDKDIISLELHREFLHFADDLIDMKIKRNFSVMEKSDILLDIDTANNNISISQDLRSASHTATSQNRPDGPKRFKSRQVLSSCSFSSGRHYWEVDVSQARSWMIGVAGESLERKINESYIGFNEKSWAIKCEKNLFASHNNIHNQLVLLSPVRAVGIYLDYEAGRLSFYELCDPIHHLHTFTASFSEPLYAALHLYDNCAIRIIK
ncbi:uncharacterized protein [Phyllobates terribilis]|uniref:uncharacterized protein n=1 Tax=Phyllobates terribilis TaxID=111132 RepID=UPI003CCAA0B0